MTSRPSPYPSDTKAKGWRLELDMEQFRQSDTWALASSMARPWLLMLWAVAWEQVPCGSLPNDDELISARLGLELDQFVQMKRVLLRNWWIAQDGRFYHDVMVSRVNAMLEKKAKDRDRKSGWRTRQSAGVTQESRVTDSGKTQDSTVADDTKHQAPSTSTSSLRSEEKASASPKPVVVLKASDIEADGVSADHARDWLKARKVPLTLTAWAGIKREADKALIGYGDVVRLMAEKGWRSFDADWIAKARGSPPRQPTAAQMAMAQACPTLVAPHLQAFTPQQTTFVEVIDDDARLLG